MNNHVVYKSDLDGGNLEVFPIESNNPGEEERGVRTIALDRANKQLYFSGEELKEKANSHYLARVDYGGFEEVQEFDMSGLNDIFSMDIFGDTLYFAHYKNEGYAKLNRCQDEIMSVSTNFSDKAGPHIIFEPKLCSDVSTF